jgi:hypothetical protein
MPPLSLKICGTPLAQLSLITRIIIERQGATFQRQSFQHFSPIENGPFQNSL